MIQLCILPTLLALGGAPGVDGQEVLAVRAGTVHTPPADEQRE